jgi:2',3'-cyclic-nucleotide 2'-phosphodiesterase (5'-nucleotidase family)
LSITLMSLTLVGCGNNNTPIEEHLLDKDLAILYTNDVHCQVGDDEKMGYSELSKCKKDLEADGNYVAVVDSGDAIQGAPIGTLSKGLYIADIMEEVGYDVAIPGNHEFDYGMENFITLSKNTSYPYISCNFMDLKTNKTVLDPYVIKQYDDVKVAFVGISTPKLLHLRLQNISKMLMVILYMVFLKIVKPNSIQLFKIQ